MTKTMTTFRDDEALASGALPENAVLRGVFCYICNLNDTFYKTMINRVGLRHPFALSGIVWLIFKTILPDLSGFPF